MHLRALARFRELGEMTPGSLWLGALTALLSLAATASVRTEVPRKACHLHPRCPTLQDLFPRVDLLLGTWKMQIPRPAPPSHGKHSPGAVFLYTLETSLGTVSWEGGRTPSFPLWKAKVMKSRQAELGKKSVSFAQGSDRSRRLCGSFQCPWCLPLNM